MPPARMRLRILLPYEVFADLSDVAQVVVETVVGSLGLLPHRLDCVVALIPGILLYTTESGGEHCAAVDEGILVKTGSDVLVSVRRAIAGDDLGRLREAVEKEFLAQDKSEQGGRIAMARMETVFLRQFANLQHG